MPRFRTVEKNDDSRSTRRLYAIGAFFACCLGILLCRAVAFHLKDNNDLERVAMRQYRTAVRDSSVRGKILDAAGREMAIDVTADSIFANPREIVNAVEAAGKLSQLLKVDRSTLLDRLSSRRKFVWVKRKATPAEVEAVKALGIEGLSFMRENSRSYPKGTIGASVLGAVGFDTEPLGGVESAYDQVLSSRSKSHDVRRDARGHLYLSPISDEGFEQPRNVELTIDNTLQYIADQSLSRAVAQARAKGGQAVVVDVDTGAILAMSNMPTFDPNEYQRYPLKSWKNSAIADPHEPGSTFKVVVVAAALDAGVARTTDTFDCEGGAIKIGINVVRDSHAHGTLSVADIIKVSSNIGAYKVEQRLGEKRVFGAIRSFGFGSSTGIDLPGESAGLLSPVSRWTPIQFATIAFGQGIAATPLQMAMAFAAIANGGKLHRPYVVKRVLDSEGQVLSETAPQVVSEPVSASTSRTMTALLRRVVEQGGTGTLAASQQYQVAGKTGTAQKADARTGSYAKGRYYASFVGFAPAEKPRIAVFVGIDEPVGAYYGGQVAAPVFREIVEGTLQYLKVPASGKGSGAAPAEEPAAPMHDMEELPVLVTEAEAGDRQVTRADDGTLKLPDFSGMTMRAVLAAAAAADIEWSFRGSGVAVRQYPLAGSIIPPGGQCIVEFRPLL